MHSVPVLLDRMAKGETRALDLTTACLDRIQDPEGQGATVFTMIDPDRSIAQAEQADAARAAGEATTPLSGVPVSVKALFDLQGHVTHAGSRVLADAPPAAADAEVVRRLRQAGAVIMGHTNMTEFAYSGLGLNPHYGTPANPADPTRIPGGSSSGAAVSVAEGMCAVGLGTDTGGSCRIPAAFCGLTGYKPTARRIPMDGTYPLSESFDSIGGIGQTVGCCEALDQVISAEQVSPAAPPDLSDLHVAVLDNYVLDDLSPLVAATFEAEVAALAKAGLRISRVTLPFLDNLPELNARGGIIAAEALAQHRELLASSGAGYDPRVSIRIRKGETQQPGEYQALLKARADMIAQADALTADYDALIMPTVAMEAPRFAEMAEDAAYGSANLLALRNTTVANLLDRCAISLPMRSTGLPAGLMLMCETMDDHRMFAMARSFETLLRR
ncbi:amidase [Pseudooceanicola lipolyticus]|uniref:Amidase n=1 Tax=Pseudooceanicola lipolyticus TaxID=2029104 RepID=A0A2M8J5E7_9RHOB|nr:amidase [Pseudooceanicola lipolyticus]PJE37997.1 amidase [Pseudooceanicola lipolyticus]